MRNRAAFPQFRAVLVEIETLLAAIEPDQQHYRLMQRVLGKLRQDFFADKIFPALVVPTLAWRALGRSENQALYILNAAHFLFYAFLDLTDDVEDHELNDPLWGQLGDPIAINAGTSLLFAALLMLDRLADQGVKTGRLSQLHRLFTQAGWYLSIGQHRDLASWRTAELSVAEVLETHRLKTGTSVRLYLESAALLAGAKSAQQASLAALGEALGVMVQILGDWINLQRPLSSDLQNHCQSLPLALLRQKLPSDAREVYLAAWLGAPKDAAAHDIMRHLLVRYDVAPEINRLLAQYRERALSALEQLRRSGCDVTDLRAFLDRFQPIGAGGD